MIILKAIIPKLNQLCKIAMLLVVYISISSNYTSFNCISIELKKKVNQ